MFINVVLILFDENLTKNGDNSTSVLVICNILRGAEELWECRAEAEKTVRQWAGMLLCKRAMQLSTDQP